MMKIKSRKKVSKKVIAVVIAAVIILIGGVAYWWFFMRDTGPVIPEKTAEQERSEKIHEKSKNDDSSSNTAAQPSAISSGKDTPETDSTQSSNSTPPETPSGTFVSNHYINLASHTAQNSVCHTSPGAQCAVVFSRGSTTRSLPAKQTDANGNTSWNWDVKELGLTAGSWTVTSKATNGQHSSTAVDQINLEIK